MLAVVDAAVSAVFCSYFCMSVTTDFGFFVFVSSVFVFSFVSGLVLLRGFTSENILPLLSFFTTLLLPLPFLSFLSSLALLLLLLLLVTVVAALERVTGEAEGLRLGEEVESLRRPAPVTIRARDV